MLLESAGSRPVIVGNSKEPRTRHPVAFTANCPHRDSGMKESLMFKRLAEREWSRVRKEQARECAGCAREECFGRFWAARVGKKRSAVLGEVCGRGIQVFRVDDVFGREKEEKSFLGVDIQYDEFPPSRMRKRSKWTKERKTMVWIRKSTFVTQLNSGNRAWFKSSTKPNPP